MNLFCIEDPSDIVSLNLSGKDLYFVKEDDMVMFDSVIEIDASENLFNFDSFKTFPALKTLSLACNNIRTINLKPDTYSTLESLNLSYNDLHPNDIAHLGLLKNLKKLVLTGNNLRYIPETFSSSFVQTDKNGRKQVADKFPLLEELHLDNNQLTEEDSFNVLSILKKLKKLYLNNNQIESIPFLKIIGKNHVKQEFGKSYEKRKAKRAKSSNESSSYNPHHQSPVDISLNQQLVKSDLDLHRSKSFRNSFILEEDEEQDENEQEQSRVEKEDEQSKLPFSELSYINLSNNLIQEEDDLIGLASWPMLNEIILHDNPIVTKHVGYPPLLKKFLIDRLGINIQRTKTLGPLRVPLNLSTIKQENRIVNTVVPKIPRIPVNERILLAIQDGPKVNSSSDSEKPVTNKTNTNEEKGSFFMTQIDHDENSPQTVDEDDESSKESNEDIYDLLNNIEDENQIKVPSTVGGCVRALKNALDHPIIYRETCKDLQKPQPPYEPKKPKAPTETIKKEKLKPSINEVNSLLEKVKTRNFIDEIKLTDAIQSGLKHDKKLAEKLLKRVQDQYNLVRFESLNIAKSPKIDVNNILEIMKNIQTGKQNNS